jgi:carbonic anhydrase/acetyltransferase-like protein (isoleucine patch superfamily)
VGQFSFEGLAPRVDPDAFVAPTATLVGDVIVEAGASIWFGAVLRADRAPVVVREGANVQDNAVVHGTAGLTADIGAGATIGQGAIVSGATIGAGALIAPGVVVLEAARVGAGAYVAAGSIVAANSEIPAGYLASGTPAQVRRPVAGSGVAAYAASSAPETEELASRYRADSHPT